MRRLILSLALMLGLGGQALAQEGRPARDYGRESWVHVGTTSDGIRFDIDMASVIVRENGQVYSVYRQAWPKTQTHGGVSFVEARMRRLDECAGDTFVALSSVRVDAAGRTVAVEEYPPTPLTVVPGSPGELVRKVICGVAARRAALTPAIPIRGAEVWNRVGPAGSQVDHYLLEDGVVLMQPGVVLALVKRVGTVLEPLPTGEAYTQTIGSHLYDCEGRQWAAVATDYYDMEGKLISTERTPREQLRPTPVLPGSTAAAVLAAACAPGVAQATQRAAQATGTGTAWLGPKGYLVTAAHVVEGGTRFTLLQNGKRVGAAELVASDAANDVAVLKPRLDGPARRILGLAAQPAPLGASIVALGYPAPDRLGVAIKATGGEVNANAGRATGRPDDPRFLQISTPVHGGNSGGPVVDQSGKVVGIVTSGLTRMGEELPQNVNFALKAAYVRTLLADLPDLGGHAGEWSVEPGGNAADRVQEAVFLILVEG
ncbi:serine protease [Phenylobacterium sp.]|jgi:S1-C subfamily serine protease|uniref:S1C family serine protease n=1 Tax=Phenylobacterium sp. TaxID=1871053 RepID=UPI002E2FE9FC|nr:serine protease [Phenylobacterium sp.]HEX2561321.1 serine protease [Phenylobacterium sp.]